MTGCSLLLGTARSLKGPKGSTRRHRRQSRRSSNPSKNGLWLGRPNGHHRDGAPDNLRHFSDPDAAWGWDSDLNQYYFGYTLFQLSCYNAELKTDIHLLLRFTSAKRHDSVSFLVSLHELGKHMPSVSIENMCLDSAMDNCPTYRILQKKEIRAFIDLNDKCGRLKTIPDTITIDKDGMPLCQEKLRMKLNGYGRFSG